MDKDAIVRLRYLCTVPTHSPESLEELQGLVEELVKELQGLVEGLIKELQGLVEGLIVELYGDVDMCESCMYYIDNERACMNPHAPYHEDIDPHAEASWNPVTGCLHGCEYCYARRTAKRFGGGCHVAPHYHDASDAIERLTQERDAANARNISKDVTMLVASDGEQPFEYEHYVCPACKNIITQRLKGSKETLWKPRYCRDCGQALDWSGPCAENGGKNNG